MKRIFSFLIMSCLLVLGACSGSNHTYNNPNLLNVNVDFNVNLSLPQYSNLQFPSNPVFVDGYGNAGVILINTGNEVYLAWDAADPNHPVDRTCSALIPDGMEAVCQCDDHNTYNLFTGIAVESKSGGDDFEYSMKPYQVIDLGNGQLRVKN